MQNRARHSLILALALLLGQWIVFAHGWQHTALTPEVDCQVCLHAPNLSSGAPASNSVALLLVATTEAPRVSASGILLSRAATRPRIRGPPSLLV